MLDSPTQSTLVHALREADRIFRIQTLLHPKVIIVEFVVFIIASSASKSGLRNRNELLIPKLDLLRLIRLSFGFTGRTQLLFLGWRFFALDVSFREK